MVGAGTAFYQSRRWCEPWWRRLAGEGPLAASVVRGSGDRIEAMAALAEVRLPVLGRWVAANVAAPVGGLGGSADHVRLAHRPDADDALDAVIHWARGWRAGLPLVLPSLPVTSPERLRFGDLAEIEVLHCPRAVVDPGADWATVTASWSKNRRKKLRLKREQLHEHGGRFEWLDQPATVLEHLDTALELHRRRWSSEGRRTQFGWDANRHAFLRDVIAGDGPGHVWIQLALVDDEPAGALLGFRLADRVHVYQSGWAPEHAELSLGLVQYAEAYRRTVETGGREFDMCRGVDAYKLRFATDVVEEVSLVRPTGARGRLVLAAASGRRRRSARTARAVEER